MATVYRDYGAINGSAYPLNEFDVTKLRLVYQATHGGDGFRLPFMNRSFISFTWSDPDGPLVHIEDFHLIATITGDRWEREGYTPFDNLTTNYDNLDGQYFWGSHYKSHSITFKLATDAIDQKELENFLHWFSPGVSRELILSEHPNRAQMARVESAPQLSLLPFEGHSTIMISGEEHVVTTTLFKGEITLVLTMDDPHWYAKDNILGKKIQETHPETHVTKTRYIDRYYDISLLSEVEITKSKDAMKILYEDGIPLGSMIENNMLLGNKAYANVENLIESLVWSQPQNAISVVDGVIVGGEGARIDGTITEQLYIERSRILLVTESGTALTFEDGSTINTDLPSDFVEDYREYVPGIYIGRIAGAEINLSDDGISSISNVQEAFFYYAGTAPSPTIISFSIMPTFSSYGYFTSLSGPYSSNLKTGANYDTITFEADKKLELQLTTPNLISSYNIAVDIILNNYFNNIPIMDIRKEIISKVRHPAVREYMASLLSNNEINDLATTTGIANKLKCFFQDNDESYRPIHFVFNSKTGEAIGDFYYRSPTSNNELADIEYAPNAQNKLNTLSATDSSLTDEQRYENIVTWGWDQYCIDSSNNLIVPTSGNASSYTAAVAAFLAYVERLMGKKKSIPTIVTIHTSVIENSVLMQSTEDVGDMLNSNSMFIYERNHPNSYGKIVRRDSSNNDNGRTFSHRVTHNLCTPLLNFQVVYKNMYL